MVYNIKWSLKCSDGIRYIANPASPNTQLARFPDSSLNTLNDDYK